MYTVLYSRSASGSGRFLYTRLPICVSSFFVVYDPISTGTGTALLSCTVLPYTNRRSGKRPGGPNRSDKTPFGPTSHSIGAIAAIASENAAIANSAIGNFIKVIIGVHATGVHVHASRATQKLRGDNPKKSFETHDHAVRQNTPVT